MLIHEPLRGSTLLQTMNTRVSLTQARFDFFAFIADAVVFLFPAMLVILYGYGMRKKAARPKHYALRVFFATVLAASINILLQMIITKARPETVLDNAHRLILTHLPTMSFPSDHAAVGMAFAVALFLGWRRYVDKSQPYNRVFLCTSIVFFLASILMSLARIFVGIHRPTDILAGRGIGALSGFLIFLLPHTRAEKLIFREETTRTYLTGKNKKEGE